MSVSLFKKILDRKDKKRIRYLKKKYFKTSILHLIYYNIISSLEPRRAGNTGGIVVVSNKDVDEDDDDRC